MVTKLFQILSLSILLFGCSIHSIDRKNALFKEVPFISHQGPGKFESYLQMNIYFPPVKELFMKLSGEESLNQKNARTEAHITVITPVEYRNILEPIGISINELDQIALKNKIQQSSFEILCIGKAQNKDDFTYYLVVDSKDLLEIRKEIFKLYISKGGNPSHFDPEHFYPHITIGYTKRDLHLETDGVYKGRNTCWRKIKL